VILNSVLWHPIYIYIIIAIYQSNYLMCMRTHTEDPTEKETVYILITCIAISLALLNKDIVLLLLIVLL